MTERGKLTPLSQLVAAENWKKRQAEKDLIRVEVWIPTKRGADLHHMVKTWRAEHELETK